MYENEYSLSGKCLKKGTYSYTAYTLLKCTCGWQSKSWNEAGYEDKEEYEELEKMNKEAKELLNNEFTIT
ncbi:MAG: hypothetical protein HFH31_03175 [Bacilli bacterium]|nr:hypothetical protein [Bacilli bacterium]